MQKIIVLGGGAAGWLTALYLNKIYKNTEVKLIESEKIGILGAGEGSTPQLVNFLKYLEIDINDLLKETKGTIKNGINFENWNGDGTKYFHGFATNNHLNNFKVENLFTEGCFTHYLNNCISKNYELDSCDYGSLLTEQNKIDLVNQDFSIHFDAHQIANYLKNVAVKRGVKHVVGEVELIEQNDFGNVDKVNLNDKSKHHCNFIFDCSGFKRLIIGGLYKTPWKDYQKHLPMKKAIPFFLKQEKDIKPCTHAVAMKYGWIWKIPLQHRFGSGYIFDSDFINEDQALDEAEKKIGHKLDSPRVISFDAGCFKSFWVNNCIAVGLSSGFTEPLEATSLFLAVQQLTLLSHFKEYLFDADIKKKKNYNEIISNSNDNVLDFLYLHYLTKRKDSDFWINFTNNTSMPETLKEKIDDLKSNNFVETNFNFKKTFAYFDLKSYLIIAHGQHLIDTNLVKEFHGLSPTIDEYKNKLADNLNNSPTHNKFLNLINSRYC
jgi:tryptophan halogenase